MKLLKPKEKPDGKRVTFTIAGMDPEGIGFIGYGLRVVWKDRVALVKMYGEPRKKRRATR